MCSQSLSQMRAVDFSSQVCAACLLSQMRTTHFASEFWVMSVMSLKPISSHIFTSPWGWAWRHLVSILPMEVGNDNLIVLLQFVNLVCARSQGAQLTQARQGLGLGLKKFGLNIAHGGWKYQSISATSNSSTWAGPELSQAQPGLGPGLKKFGLNITYIGWAKGNMFYLGLQIK